MPNQRNDTRDRQKEVPPLYRYLIKFILKLLNPSFPFFIVRRFPSLEGIFYAIVVPLLLFFSGILTLWLFPTASLTFGFPLNIVLTLLLPTILLIVFLRIQIERKVNWWKSIFGSSAEWNASKSLDELIELFKKKPQRHRRKVTK